MFIYNNFDYLIILFKRIKLKKIIKFEIKDYYFVNTDL